MYNRKEEEDNVKKEEKEKEEEDNVKKEEKEKEEEEIDDGFTVVKRGCGDRKGDLGNNWRKRGVRAGR